ncbi:hypothetical protein [Herpetosiphon giganteus]|uniref:hypothetical protein n=1 Tax=Herpetosiphon giganteus TaxID=2029754 RepID=UPI0019565CAD|nr:hypothetical protein [Herpetosiphon giganteus]MBM7846550.1 hypothetical protein [Herpetosiphon giganteus]
MQYHRGIAGTMVGIPLFFMLIAAIYGPREVILDSLLFYVVIFSCQLLVTNRRVGALLWVSGSLAGVVLGNLIADPLFDHGLAAFLRHIMVFEAPYERMVYIVIKWLYGGIVGIMVGLLQARMLSTVSLRRAWMLATIVAFSSGYARWFVKKCAKSI